MSAPRTISSVGIDKFEYHKRFTVDRSLSHAEVHILAVLWDFSDRHGLNIRPGRDTVREAANVSKRKLDETLNKLVTVGFLSVHREGGRAAGGRGMATVYALSVPAHWETSPLRGDAHQETSPLSNDHFPPQEPKPHPSGVENLPPQEGPIRSRTDQNRSTASDPAATDSKSPGSVAQQIADDDNFEWKQTPHDDPWTSNYGSDWDWSTDANTA